MASSSRSRSGRSPACVDGEEQARQAALDIGQLLAARQVVDLLLHQRQDRADFQPVGRRDTWPAPRRRANGRRCRPRPSRRARPRRRTARFPPCRRGRARASRRLRHLGAASAHGAAGRAGAGLRRTDRCGRRRARSARPCRLPRPPRAPPPAAGWSPSAASSEEASASTGSSRLSPAISTPWPAKKTSATSAPGGVLAKIVERAAHAAQVAVALERTPRSRAWPAPPRWRGRR